MDHTPFLIALRILGRLGISLPPGRADVRPLKESVVPRETKLPIEDLCYLIIKRELNVPPRLRRRITRPGLAGTATRERAVGGFQGYMNLNKTLPRLYVERRKLDGIIASLEQQLQRSTAAKAAAALKSRPGRKSCQL